MSVLTLIRHGETQANLDGVWHGSTDTPLTERGHAQAARVAAWASEHLADTVAVYSSPLQRAHHTAQAIGGTLSLAPQTDTGLGEYDLGAWEGVTYRDLYSQYRLWEHMKTDPDFAPHGGESPRQVSDRFTESLRRIATLHREERVIVVTHGGALSLGLAQIVSGTYTEWGSVMDNCAVTELVLEPEVQLLSFNRTEHLEGL